MERPRHWCGCFSKFKHLLSSGAGNGKCGVTGTISLCGREKGTRGKEDNIDLSHLPLSLLLGPELSKEVDLEKKRHRN